MIARATVSFSSVPMNFTTLLLYWNKDMFKEAGLDPNRPPQNWQEQLQYAQKLTKRGAPEAELKTRLERARQPIERKRAERDGVK